MVAFDLDSGGRLEPLIARWPGPWVHGRSATAVEEEFELLRSLGESHLAVPKAGRIAPRDAASPERQFYVMERIDAEPNLSPRHPIDYAFQCARLLAGIHEFDFRAHGLAGIRRLKNPWSSAEGEPDGRILEAEIRSALERIGAQDGDNARVLRHGDFWPGNLLCRGDEIVAIVDWENASLGDPLLDVSITRLDLLWVLGEEAMEAFTAEYLNLRAVCTRLLPYFDLVAAIRPAGQIDDFQPAYPDLGRPDITLEMLLERQNAFANRALAELKSAYPRGLHG